MRRLNDFLGQVILLVLFFVMGATPLVVLVLAVMNFIRAQSRRGTIVLQALASVIVWIFLTYALALIFMMMVFSATYPSSDFNDLKSTGWFALGGFIYTMLGALLVYWTRRQARLSQ